MAQHHDGMNDERMKALFDSISKVNPDLKLGATGKFPLGKLTPSDEGELRFAVGVEYGKVVIHFGKEVAWIGMEAEQALELAEIIKEKANNILERR